MLAKKTGSAPDWLKRLDDVIDEIKDVMRNPESITLSIDRFKYIPKEKGSPVKRVAANYDLKSSIIISLVSNYMTDHADTAGPVPYFTDHSFAFRSSRLRDKHNKSFNYHKAVRAIEEFRKIKISEGLYVAEIDLEKFYDTLNHNELRKTLEKLVSQFEQAGAPVDRRALVMIDKYLSSFGFNLDILPREDPGKREFKWPGVKLEGLGVDIKGERIGVPQGGALSCFFANLLLHELDSVFDDADPDLLYLRYCDDFIVIHKDKLKCQEYVDRALLKLNELKLVAHSPADYVLTDYKRRVAGKNGKGQVNEFWNVSKSKSPYRWGRYSPEGAGKANVPYVGFVGYQLRHDGVVRVRKRSLLKEFAKQRELTELIIRRLKQNPSATVKLTEKQIVFRAEQKLIAMSVGKKNEKNLDKALDYCFCNGFKVMRRFPTRANNQLRTLDSSRERQLARLKKGLLKFSERFPRYTKGAPVKRLPKKETSYFRYFNPKHRTVRH